MSLATLIPVISQLDSYTIVASGTKVTLAGGSGRAFSLQVASVGTTATAWSVILEGSLNGTTYTSIATHISGTNADGVTVTALTNGPWLFVRSRLVSVTLTPATSLTVIWAAS